MRVKRRRHDNTQALTLLRLGIRELVVTVSAGQSLLLHHRLLEVGDRDVHTIEVHDVMVHAVAELVVHRHLRRPTD